MCRACVSWTRTRSLTMLSVRATCWCQWLNFQSNFFSGVPALRDALVRWSLQPCGAALMIRRRVVPSAAIAHAARLGHLCASILLQGGGCNVFSPLSAWTHPFVSDGRAYREGADALHRVVSARRGRDFVPAVRPSLSFLFLAPRLCLWWASPSRMMGTRLSISALFPGAVGCLFATPPTAAYRLCRYLR